MYSLASLIVELQSARRGLLKLLKCICRKWCRGRDYSWHVQHLLREFGCGPLAESVGRGGLDRGQSTPLSAVDVGRITEQRQGFAEKEVIRLRQDLLGLGKLELQPEAAEWGGVIEIRKRCSARVIRIDHSG